MNWVPWAMGFQVQVAVSVPALTLRDPQPLMIRPLARNATVPVDEVTALRVKVPPLRGVLGVVSVMDEVPVATVMEIDWVAVAPASSVAVMVKEVALRRAALDETETTLVVELMVIPETVGESVKLFAPVPPEAVRAVEAAATPKVVEMAAGAEKEIAPLTVSVAAVEVSELVTPTLVLVTTTR